VFQSASPSSVSHTCPVGATVDAIEETTTSTSGLSYDPAADQYVYAWKTASSWAGSCRKVVVKLKDGSAAREALFQFVK
jgi:hypothetical protein